MDLSTVPLHCRVIEDLKVKERDVKGAFGDQSVDIYVGGECLN